ncbi:aldo/keto reductase [Sphingomonas parva]|uniref:aldo/keto reductase n=1 Tax=Sphingomonas parva TaxID=2555898 RepID=UPI001431A306|nr:aldo/keto reductase [Sphingomonas parva]
MSELTLGTTGLGRPGLDPAEAAQAVDLALGSGINTVELAAADRQAVSILAEAIRARGGAAPHVLCRATSRVAFDLPSPHVHAGDAYPGAALRTETEQLLRDLGVERLALVQLHAWCPEWLDEGDWLETLLSLRQEGKIAAIGVSLFDHDVPAGLDAVASGRIDCVQLMYNLFDQAAAEEILPLCRRHDVGAVARSPLYFGGLSPRLAQPFPAGDWRAAYFFDSHRRETRARAEAIAASLGLPIDALPALALRFALSHPAVTTVAVGMHRPDHVAANLAAAAEGPLPAETLERLAGHRWLS